MYYLIDRVSITYHSTDIKPSVVLSLFFRMLGVYVHERIVNNPPASAAIPDGFCVNVYLLTKSFPPDSVSPYLAPEDSQDRNIFFVDKGLSFALEEPEGKIVTCDLSHDTCGLLHGMSQALFEILKKTYENCLQHFEKVESDWKQLIQIYLDHRLYELTFTGKFFYADPDLIRETKEAYRGLIHALKKDDGTWAEDEEKFYRQFAIINMAYEINALCVRGNCSGIYNSAEIIQLCDMMIDHYGRCTSLLLLKGQVLDDLQSLPSEAYKYYKECYKQDTFNVYALYKVGLYREKYLRLYDMAVDDYKRALTVYPPYYRVIYRWAVCEENRDDVNEAIRVYKRIIEVLTDKYENKTGSNAFEILVRPMEIEYLFKSAMRIAGLYEYGLKDSYKAVEYYLKANEIYKLIDKSLFLTRIFEDNGSDKPCKIVERLNGIIKAKLNIGRVREKLDGYENLINNMKLVGAE